MEYNYEIAKYLKYITEYLKKIRVPLEYLPDILLLLNNIHVSIEKLIHFSFIYINPGAIFFQAVIDTDKGYKLYAGPSLNQMVELEPGKSIQRLFVIGEKTINFEINYRMFDYNSSMPDVTYTFIPYNIDKIK